MSVNLLECSMFNVHDLNPDPVPGADPESRSASKINGS